MKELFDAIEKNDYNKVKELIKKGANVNTKTVSDWTPLMEAATRGHKKIVELLIRSGADIKARDVLGNTALVYAHQAGHKDIVRVLNGTGLYDKNGEEIYEGDILTEGEYRYEIIWIKEEGKYCLKGKIGNTYEYSDIYWDTLKHLVKVKNYKL